MLAIIAVLAAMVVPNLLGTQKRANIKVTRSSISTFENAVKMYAAERNNGEYPTGGSDEVIELLMATEDADGDAVDPLLERMPDDAWGNPLHYEYPNGKADSTIPAIWSSGPNGNDENGGGDDVANWDDGK